MIALSFFFVGACAVLLMLLTKKQTAKRIILVLHASVNLLIATFLYVNHSIPSTSGFFRIDALAIFEVILSCLIFFAVSIYAGGYVSRLVETGELSKKSLNLFYGGFSLLMAVTPVVFLSDNLALFWILAEITTVISAMLVASLSARENIDAAITYIFIASTAMLFSFVGLIFLFELSRHLIPSGTLNWSSLMNIASGFDPVLVLAAFFFVFIGFSTKSGIVPFHTWLPQAHAKAPSAVSAVLSGVLLNIGIYGIIRVFAIVRQVPGTEIGGTFLLFFGLLTISIASMMMLRQTNLKKLIAFSSIENMGFILIGIALWTPVAFFWVLFYIIAHSVTKAELFLSAGILHRQYRSEIPDEEDRIVDAFTMQPGASLALLVGALAIAGTPLFPIFLPKFLIIADIFSIMPGIGFFILFPLAIAAFAFIRFIFTSFSLSSHGIRPEQYNVPMGMYFSLLFLLLCMVLIGIGIPQVLEAMMNTIVDEIGLHGGV